MSHPLSFHRELILTISFGFKSLNRINRNFDILLLVTAALSAFRFALLLNLNWTSSFKPLIDWIRLMMSKSLITSWKAIVCPTNVKCAPKSLMFVFLRSAVKSEPLLITSEDSDEFLFLCAAFSENLMRFSSANGLYIFSRMAVNTIAINNYLLLQSRTASFAWASFHHFCLCLQARILGSCTISLDSATM